MFKEVIEAVQNNSVFSCFPFLRTSDSKTYRIKFYVKLYTKSAKQKIGVHKVNSSFPQLCNCIFITNLLYHRDSGTAAETSMKWIPLKRIIQSIGVSISKDLP